MPPADAATQRRARLLRMRAAATGILVAMAVVFAMLTSYFLSRTLVPTMMRYLLRHAHPDAGAPRSLGARFIAGFERQAAA